MAKASDLPVLRGRPTYKEYACPNWPSTLTLYNRFLANWKIFFQITSCFLFSSLVLLHSSSSGRLCSCVNCHWTRAETSRPRHCVQRPGNPGDTCLEHHLVQERDAPDQLESLVHFGRRPTPAHQRGAGIRRGRVQCQGGQPSGINYRQCFLGARE